MPKIQKILLMYQPAEYAHIRDLLPDAQIEIATSEASAKEMIGEADVVLGNRYFLQSLPHATCLQWMQSNSMGVDVILKGAGDQLDEIILTSAKGLYKDEVADHALALILGLTRNLKTAVEDYLKQAWGRWTLRTLHGLNALVIGWGATGQAIGQRLRAFGVQVQGVRRSIHNADYDESGCFIHTWQSWYAVLPTIDILIIAAPLTEETYHLVDGAVLSQLPNDALVINIARGDIVDEEALLSALINGTLGGAGLDTIHAEPPPPDDPIWHAPNLLLTPHVARSLEHPPYRWEALFLENLRRYVHDEPLLNVVDKKAGY